MKKLIATAVAAIALLGARPVYAQANLPAQPEGWVADSAGMFTTEDINSMKSEIRSFEGNHNVRIVVLTLTNTNGEDPKSICVRALNGWNAGMRSVLIFASVEPRKLYVQPGTDLKYVFNESVCTSICRDTMAPLMKAGQRPQAFRAGIQAVQNTALAALSSSASVAGPVYAASLPWYERWGAKEWITAILLVCLLIFVLWLIFGSSRRGYGYSSGYYGGGGPSIYSEPNYFGSSGSSGSSGGWFDGGSSSSSSSSSYDSGGGGSSYDSGGSFSCDSGGGGGGDY